jgi:hypothetical protein
VKREDAVNSEPDPAMHVRVYFLLALLRHYYVTCSNWMFAFVADGQSLWQSGGAEDIENAQGSGFQMGYCEAWV